MSNQKSIISYVPQPFFGSTVTVSKILDVDIMRNPSGLLDPDLTNYTELISTNGGSAMACKVAFDANTAWLEGQKMTIALIGCSMTTYEDDGSGQPDLSTATAEDFQATVDNAITDETTIGKRMFSHVSKNTIRSFDADLPGVISGGEVNLVASSMPTGDPASSPYVALAFLRYPDNVSARPHSKIIIGHVFIGVDIPISIDPNTFSWSLGTRQNRSRSRSLSTISSNGSVLRSASCGIVNIPLYELSGLDVGPPVPPSGELNLKFHPNLFDLNKVNNAYPVLFNPYPSPASAGSFSERANFSARESFFSIYGFIDNGFEVQLREFRDGLNSEYRARFSITETR